MREALRNHWGKFLFLFLFAVYSGAILYEYQNARADHTRYQRVPLKDERMLKLIEKAEGIVQPDVGPIHYYRFITAYSFMTTQDKDLFWPFSVDAAYHIHGIWPFKNQEVVLITDAALDNLDDNMLLFMIGHELGHIKENHFWRGKGLPYAHRALFLRIAGKLLNLRSVQRWAGEKYLEMEFAADDAGIQCASPEIALFCLRFLELTILSNASTARYVFMKRIERIREKYKAEIVL